MLNIASFLIKQSNLISDDARRVGLIRDESSPYSKGMQERRRAREESERLGWEKLQNTLRTGQGYQDWMGEYFLEGLGLRNLKQLDDPRVQEYFLRKAEGKDPGNMHHIGLYQPAGFFMKRDSGNRLLNAAVEYIKNKRNAASVKPQETSQPVSTSAPTATPAAAAPANVAPNVAPSANASATTPAQNTLADTTINVADFNKPYSLDDARAIVAQGLDGKTPVPTATGATNSTAATPAPAAATPATTAVSAATPTAAPTAQGQQEIPESSSEVTPQSKSTAVKNPLISIQQARELLAKGIAPTSIGGYHQTLGADGTNPQAQQELELMAKDPTYNPFANTQAKYVQNLNKMRLLDQYNPENIMAENQRIQQNQAKLDADRRSRMNAAKYYAGQGVQGASDYHNYMTRGGQLSPAGQQWRDNFDVAGWNQQQQAQQQQARQQHAQPQQTQWKSELDGPRDQGEQAYMRSVLGYSDTGSGVGSHAAGQAWAAKNNSMNGLSSSTAKPVKNPITQPK